MTIEKITEYLKLAEKATPGQIEFDEETGAPLVSDDEFYRQLEESEIEFVKDSITMGPVLAQALLEVDKYLESIQNINSAIPFERLDWEWTCKFQKDQATIARADIERILGEAQ